MFDEDLDQFLEDHGLPCTCGTNNFLGIMDEADENQAAFGMNAISAMIILTVKTSDVSQANIKNGSAVLVDGVAYTARNPVRLDDGSFSNIPLTRVK